MKGEGIYCYVVLPRRSGACAALADELVAHVADAIGPFVVPDTVHFVPALPRARSGKLIRRILRKIAEGDADGLGDTSTLADPSTVDDLRDGPAAHLDDPRGGAIMSTLNMDNLFDPKSIAVIGASNRKDSVGYILLHNIIAAEYEGVVYPVNPNARAVQAIQCYDTISRCRARSTWPSSRCPPRGCPTWCATVARAGVNACVIVSAGFKEVGAEGKRLEDQVLSIAKSYDLRILGPNCLGFSRPATT